MAQFVDVCFGLPFLHQLVQVATSFLLRPGDAEMLQRAVARVLRVESLGIKVPSSSDLGFVSGSTFFGHFDQCCFF